MYEYFWILVLVLLLAFLIYSSVDFIKNYDLYKSMRSWKLVFYLLLIILSIASYFIFKLYRTVYITYEVNLVIFTCLVVSGIAVYTINSTFNVMKKVKEREEKLINLNFVLDNETQSRADEFENKAYEFEDKNKQLAIQAEILSEKEEELKRINLQLGEAHKQLEREKNSVEQKVVERTKELNEEKETVEKLLTQKTEFINQLSHDLRTPITPLLNLLPFLKKKEKDPKNLELIEICIRNTNYLQKLVLATLSLARLGARNIKLELSKVSVYEMIKDIIDQGLFNKKDSVISIINKVDKGVSLNLDKLRIREAFENIIGNAIKYNESKKKEITITSEVKGNIIILRFTDNGIGIEPKNLNMMFTEFYKVDPSRHQHDSSGLGLSITKRIIELHNGKVSVSSKGIGKGITITMEFPM